MERDKKIRLYSLIIAATVGVTSFSGGKDKDKEDISTYSNFDDFAYYRLREAKAEMCYSGKNIVIVINKKNGEVTRYIYNNTFLKDEIYELDTGEIIYYSDFIVNNYGENILENKDNNLYIINFSEISDYIVNKECQDWYNIEEINDMQKEILELIPENKSLTKIRS